MAWGKFRKLLPVLTSRHLSPRIQGKVYEACICSAMLHGSETWGPKEAELRRLCYNDHVIIHWICGIKDRDKTPSASLLQKLDIKDITLVLHSQRLRWYGHGQQATSSTKSITNFQIFSTRKKGRPRKTWSECVRLMSMSVAYLALTHLTEMHGELVFNMAWCCQPHRVGHGQHINLKWIWIDGWMDGWMDTPNRTSNT